jgi:hypothetical protein
MNKLILAAILAAATTMAGVIDTTILVATSTTNAVTDYFDIGDRAQIVRQIDSVEVYVTQPNTNHVTTVNFRQELGTGLTNTFATYSVQGTGATLLYPLRSVDALAVSGAATNAVQHTYPYAISRAFITYAFAAATNSAVAVACTNGVSIHYKILTR